MKSFTLFVITMIALTLCVGCSKTYYGKFITAKVKEEPIDEFQADGYVALAFENKKQRTAEDWLWEFWVYYDNQIYFKYWLKSKIVAGTRNYYLEEEIPGSKPRTTASFTARPNYDRVKDRLISDLQDKGPQDF